jgi:hypothetical protein
MEAEKKLVDWPALGADSLVYHSFYKMVYSHDDIFAAQELGLVQGVCTHSLLPGFLDRAGLRRLKVLPVL